ncbi:MAG TPA: energy-coupling factor transporter ATPase, partial [Bacillota bacterium]|nr:energy-coupling factor transporter ATPase [Bacillota bacterium]
EFVGIIGQTGSGKSTLVQLFNGLLRPTSGQAEINGFEISKPDVKLRVLRQQVGLVFQFPEHQLFGETVEFDVGFGPRNQGLPDEEISERVRDALALVDLDADIGQRSPFELSGGQMRRVAIAGVLAMKPSILILDEPTAGLDPRGRDEILEKIASLHREKGITVILVTHSMEDVARLVDRLVVIHRGEINYDGPPEEVFRHAETLTEMGLSVPQSTLVLQALRKRGWDVPEVALTEEEARQAILTFLQRRDMA